MDKQSFAKKLIDWYGAHHRKLPWRETEDPYKIWLSEIILQQTRVAQGLPYYTKFVDKFPTVQALAKAPEQQVMRLWQGLGYYSRARNLHVCAKKVVKEYSGVFPKTFVDLQKLPGIGSYTAAAIASFAFGEKVAVVDGNVFRVLARILGSDVNIASPEGKFFFTEKANELIDEQQPGLFNQAIMEFGALHCTPTSPGCETCIFSKRCVANQRGLQKLLPVKEKKLNVRKRYFYYVAIRYQQKWLMKKREGKDIWNGLYDFFLVETTRNQKWQVALSAYPDFALGTAVAKFNHVLTHQQLFAVFIEVEVTNQKKFLQLSKELQLKAYDKKQIDRLPKPVLIMKYLQQQG